MTPLRRTGRELPGILKLAVPIVVGLSASTLIGVTDSLMVAPLGAEPLAAVGLTASVSLIVVAAVWGMLSAVSVRIGAAHGARAGRQVAAILRGGLWLGLMAGVAGMAAMGGIWLLLPHLGQPAEVLAIMPAYWALMAGMLVPFAVLTVFKSAFEAVDRPWLGTAFAFLGVVLNVPLNYVLIWGIGPFPALGLTGAGVASLVAEGLALFAAFLWWLRAASLRRLRVRAPVVAGDVAATAREGAPLGLLYIAETGAMSVATLVIGLFGALALAGNQIAWSISGVLYMVPLGVAGAVAIRVAQARGAGDGAAIRPIVAAALVIALGWLSVAAVTLTLFAAPIAGLVTADPAVIAAAAPILAVFALSQVGDGLQSTLLGALRGLSDTAWPAMVSLIAYWGVGLPLGAALALWGGMGPPGMWLGFVVALFGAGLALAWRFWRATGLGATDVNVIVAPDPAGEQA